MVKDYFSLNHQADTPPLWKRLAEAFPNRYAVVPEAELIMQPEKFGATEGEILDVVEWAKDRNLVAESAAEPRCLGLTPQGRRLWRELMGEI